MTMLRSVCVMAMLSLAACDPPRSTGGNFLPPADAAPGNDAVTTPDVVAAQPDVVTTQDDVVAAQPDVVMSQPDVVTSPTDVVVAQPDVVMAARCGDGTCTRRMMENCQSCPSDCGACTFSLWCPWTLTQLAFSNADFLQRCEPPLNVCPQLGDHVREGRSRRQQL